MRLLFIVGAVLVALGVTAYLTPADNILRLLDSANVKDSQMEAIRPYLRHLNSIGAGVGAFGGLVVAYVLLAISRR